MKPQYSIVVPVHNSSKTIERCLGSIESAASGFNVELIVVDDASTDDSAKKARSFTDTVISLPKCGNRLEVRMHGFQKATAPYVVNVDSDIVVPMDFFLKLGIYLAEHSEISGCSAILSARSGHNGFFSRFKHLYMNYIYRNTPNPVSFLYGSLFVLRNEASILSSLKQLSQKMVTTITDDTEAGLLLTSQGHCLHLMHGTELAHLKEFNFLSLLRNDFDVPYDFGKLWWSFGKTQAVINSGGRFTHTSYRQLLSLVAAVISVTLFFYNLPAALLFLCGWLVINFFFLAFLLSHFGILRSLVAFPFNFIDNVVMLAGIVSGLVSGGINFFRCYGSGSSSQI